MADNWYIVLELPFVSTPKFGMHPIQKLKNFLQGIENEGGE
jgi:hypothetical protein